jgi:predicted ATP-dependent protease
MYGAKLAGCKTVLFPKENMKSYETILSECPDLIDDTFKAYPVSTFDEALNFCLVSTSIPSTI